MKKPYNSVKNRYEGLIICIILCIVVFLTIGYSAFSTELGINGISAIVRVQKDVRIDGISLSSVAGNATSQYEEYNVKNIYTSISLPENNSSVTYDVVIHNLGNVEMGILDISGLPSNLKYSISNYNLKDALCDDETPSQCKLGTTTTLHLKIEYNENGYDESNTDYTLNLNFNFKRVFSITYKNITDNNYPKTILEDETLNITFVDDIPSNVNIIGVTTYTYTPPTLTISNPTNNVVITGLIYSKYYERLVFDGSNYEDTRIYLFNEENINKNFEISFDLTNVEASQISQATIVNSMEEISPYPGFVFRVQTNGTQIEFNSPKIKNRTGINISTIEKVVIKRINDIYYLQINDGTVENLGTYSGGTFDVPVTLGSSPDTNPPRHFKGTLENVNIKVYDPERYIIKFHSNGGTGTMADQSVRVDDSVALNANTFEKEGSMFDGWNTKADGSGTTYHDRDTIINLANADETVNLYAIWSTPFKYNVEFYPNGGTGTMLAQEFEYGTYQNLSSNLFTKTDRTFVRWNTKADGSGINYKDRESVKNLTKTANDTISLYAIWAEEYYYKSSETFDGTNCINDTNISLYSADNVSKDYEISFEIVSNGSNSNQATLMNAMYEVNPWPGVLIRTTGSQFEFDMNGGSKSYNKKYTAATTKKVMYKRKNGKIYIGVNDGELIEATDHSSITTFNTPVTFGCSLTSSNQPQRYYKGTLKDMEIILFE